MQIPIQTIRTESVADTKPPLAHTTRSEDAFRDQYERAARGESSSAWPQRPERADQADPRPASALPEKKNASRETEGESEPPEADGPWPLDQIEQGFMAETTEKHRHDDRGTCDVQSEIQDTRGVALQSKEDGPASCSNGLASVPSADSAPHTFLIHAKVERWNRTSDSHVEANGAEIIGVPWNGRLAGFFAQLADPSQASTGAAPAPLLNGESLKRAPSVSEPANGISSANDGPVPFRDPGIVGRGARTQLSSAKADGDPSQVTSGGPSAPEDVSSVLASMSFDSDSIDDPPLNLQLRPKADDQEVPQNRLSSKVDSQPTLLRSPDQSAAKSPAIPALTSRLGERQLLGERQGFDTVEGGEAAQILMSSAPRIGIEAAAFAANLHGRLGPLPAPWAQLAQSVIGAVQTGNGTVTELILSPESLGKVRFQITGVDDKLTIKLSAERPDTFDLLRRQADMLLSELKQAGIASGNLSFSSWAEGRDQSGHLKQLSTTQTEGAPAPASDSSVSHPAWAVPGRLHIRL